MVMSVRARRTQRTPRHSPLVWMGRVVSLVVSIATMPGIWGATSRRIRLQVSTQDGESDMQQQLQRGRIPWWAPILMLAARPVFALVTHLVVAAGLRLQRRPNPLREA